YEIRLQYLLYQGNWWLRVGDNWAGYYPSSIYKGGQLSRYSNLLEFGGESVPGYFEGVNVWPSEGSTLFSSSGWSYASYQPLIFYVNTSGTSVWASLTADQPSPACYTITGPAYNSSWVSTSTSVGLAVLAASRVLSKHQSETKFHHFSQELARDDGTLVY